MGDIGRKLLVVSEVLVAAVFVVGFGAYLTIIRLSGGRLE